MTDTIRAALESARVALREGDRVRAEESLRRVLRSDPTRPEALFALGAIALQEGRSEEAVPLLEKGLARASNSAQAHANLAAALQNLGRNDEAVSAAQRALELQANHATALNILGNALRGLGRSEEAIAAFERALGVQPGAAVIHLNLAAALKDAGRFDDALDAYHRAIAIAPGDADAHLMTGVMERSLGRLDDAARNLIRAIDIRPDFPEAHNAVGNLLVDAGQSDAAEASYRLALEQRPAYPEALYNLGNLLRQTPRLGEARDAFARVTSMAPEFPDAHVRLGQTCLDLKEFDTALVHLSRAAELRPDHPEILSARGDALRALGRFDDAAADYTRAVRLRHDFAVGHTNLSTVSLDRGLLAEAKAHAHRAIAAQPDLAEAHWNLAQALLAGGEWLQGWRKYEYRLLRATARELAFPFPVWDGTPLAGRRLFVTAEQGVGDEVMFASCLAEAIREAGQCVVECDARLVPLFDRSFPGATFIGRLPTADVYPSRLAHPDWRVAIGSLPMHWRNGEEEFPHADSYLAPDPQAVGRWRGRYEALGPGLKVGIAWRGGKEALAHRARSIPLARWTELAPPGGVHWIQLQYGDTADDRRAAREAGLEVHHWGDADPLVNLDDFAAQIAALDLVISIDNATVHMAGALGVPTWVMLPAVADWRWMTDRDDSPWYPSLRLFRQRSPGEWRPVFERVRELLEERVAGTREARAGVRRPHRPRREHPSVALLNDTTHWYHWGCTGTSTAIVRTLEDRGYAVHRVPITSLHPCGEVPRTIEAFDDPAAFRRFASANAWLMRELVKVDFVVVNGEGSLHGSDPSVLSLLYLAYAAKAHLGKNVQIVNHSCYPENSLDLGDSEVWRLYRKVYEAMDYVAVREPLSRDLLERAGVAAVQAFDCLPLTIAARYVPSGERRPDEIVVAGSVARHDADMPAWAEFVERMLGAGIRPRVLIGADLFPAPEETEFAAALDQRFRGRIEVVDADSFERWIETLARASVLVSGRFHHTIAAATLGTPFVMLDSNTPKNAGLATLLGAPPPLALDAPRLADELVARTEGALREGQGSVRPRVAELCGWAMRNFQELPARESPRAFTPPR